MKRKTTMIFAKIKTLDGYTESNLYWYWDALYHDTFSPESEILFLLPFEIHGKTYRERKESLYNLAVSFQYNNDGDTDINLSYSEIGYIQEYFECMGKKYGLLREFKENCIC